jgi:hypothetical protein
MWVMMASELQEEIPLSFRVTRERGLELVEKTVDIIQSIYLKYLSLSLWQKEGNEASKIGICQLCIILVAVDVAVLAWHSEQ